ncbi:MAG TPA: hypothetical protein DIW81_08210, partial [Planctomycetaceae bacterium]|nr:hypothetical protein [Planctomycetaceae bacterium]
MHHSVSICYSAAQKEGDENFAHPHKFIAVSLRSRSKSQETSPNLTDQQFQVPQCPRRLIIIIVFKIVEIVIVVVIV